MMHRSKKVFFVVFFCSLVNMLSAQKFKVKAALEPVGTSRFYKIPVRPDLTAHAKADLSDLRITDHSNQQVPFIIRPSLPVFIANPPLSFVQKDSSNGTTYITVKQKEAYHLDRVILSLDGTKYYKRVAHLYQIHDKGKKQYVVSFEIASNRLPVISFGTLKAKNLLIEIENKDNPPLEVQAVRTEQSSKDLVAYLEKGESYMIMAGNERIEAPQYDLLQFRDSIPTQLARLSYKDIELVEATVQRKFLPDMSNWLWPAILIVISVLGFLTYKLLADMKRSGI